MIFFILNTFNKDIDDSLSKRERKYSVVLNYSSWDKEGIKSEDINVNIENCSLVFKECNGDCSGTPRYVYVFSNESLSENSIKKEINNRLRNLELKHISGIGYETNKIAHGLYDLERAVDSIGDIIARIANKNEKKEIVKIFEKYVLTNKILSEIVKNGYINENTFNKIIELNDEEMIAILVSKNNIIEDCSKVIEKYKTALETRGISIRDDFPKYLKLS